MLAPFLAAEAEVGRQSAAQVISIQYHGVAASRDELALDAACESGLTRAGKPSEPDDCTRVTVLLLSFLTRDHFIRPRINSV